MTATCHRPKVPAILAVIGLALAVARCAAGCFEQIKHEAAAAGYEAQQMRCVEQYADRESIDKCRDKVKLAWTVDKSLDAGPEAGRTLNIGFDNDGGQR